MKTRKEIEKQLRAAISEMFLLIDYKKAELKSKNCDEHLIKILNIDISEQIINRRYCHYLLQNKIYTK